MTAQADAAIANAVAVRAALARSSADDRDDQLRAALDALSAGMAPIRSRLLQAPTVGRSAFEPELREASAALQRERRRVREMLNRKHGGRAEPKRPLRHKLLRSFQGTVRQAKGEAREIAVAVDEARDARAVLRRMRAPWYEWERHVTKPGCEALDDLSGLLRRVASAQARCEMDPRGSWPSGLEKRLRNLIFEADALRSDVRLIRDRAQRLATAKPPSQPQWRERRKHRPWTAEAATHALDAWAAEHGRRPRARDLTHPDLPSYGTVHALLGGLTD